MDELTLVEEVFAVSFLEERRHLAPGVMPLVGLRPESRTDAPNYALIEEIIVERLTSAQTDVLTYLIECHKRAEARAKAFQTPLLDHIRDMLVSYAGLTLLGMFDFFNQPPDISKQGAVRLFEFIQRSLHDPGKLPVLFLDQLARRFHGRPAGEDLMTLLAPGLDRAVCDATKTDFLAFWRTGTTSHIAGLFRRIASRDRDPAIGEAMVQTPAWFGSAVPATGVSIETQSLLGALLRQSPFPVGPPQSYAPGTNPVGDALFPDPRDVTHDDLVFAQSTVRSAVTQITSTALSVIKMLLQTTAKDATLDWIAKVTDVNVQRTQLGYQTLLSTATNTASNDGFLTNLAVVMLGLCEPFMDPSSKRVALIDASYFMSPACRVDVSKDTRIAATGDQIAAWCDRDNLARVKARLSATPDRHVVDDEEDDVAVAESFGTVTEFFFLTARCLHVGPLALFARMDSMYRELHEIQGQLQELEQMMADAPAAQRHMLQPQRDLFQQRVERMLREIYCYRTGLDDPEFNEALLRYARLVAVWVLRLVGYDFRSPGPLPVKAPPLFRALPEHILENVGHILSHVLHYNASVLNAFPPSSFDDLLTFIVAFLGADTYITNPYIRVKYVELLAALVPSDDPDLHRRPTPFDAYPRLFEANELACTRLVPNLLRFYVDVEFSGTHNAFYEKLVSRSHITKVLEYLWNTADFRAAFHAESRSEGFVRFVNMIINDSTYCVDGAMTELTKINEIETLMASSEWAHVRDVDREIQRRDLTQSTRLVRHHLQNANNVVGMLLFLTSEIVSPFMRSGLAVRIAAMLNDWLHHIIGPRSSALKVGDPEKYNFHPKVLLKQVCSVYLHLSVSAEFAPAVAHDGRSYRPENFSKAAAILERYGLASDDDIARFRAFSEAVREAKSNETSLDEMFGDDIPAEYLDPITEELMKDPVILPLSKTRCDRSTIARHLLSDPTDPFNRSFLSIDMVESDTQLKDEIEQFVSKMQSEHRRRILSADAANR
jgi:ubiquitin conjugation factor E4 B